MAGTDGLERGPAHKLIHIVTAPEDLARHKGALEADLIVDAVLGTGFKPPLKGLALAALEWVKASRAPILAVDLPSGWPADETGATVATPVFPADAVITFTAPKPAHVFGQLTRRWDQPIVVAPIGSPQEAIVSALGSASGPARRWSWRRRRARRRPTRATSGTCWWWAGRWERRAANPARRPWRLWARCGPEQAW